MTKTAPTPPIPPKVASIAAALGDRLDIEHRFDEAAWKIANARTYGASAEGLMLTAGIKTAWALEREHRKIVRWPRRTQWAPCEREALGAEIAAAVQHNWYLHALVRVRIDNVIAEAIAGLNISDYDRRIMFDMIAEDAMTNLTVVGEYMKIEYSAAYRKKHSAFVRLVYSCSLLRSAVFTHGN